MKLHDLLIRLHIPADLKQEIFTPSPIGTLVWSALFVIVIGAILLLFWPRPTPAVKTSFTERLLGRVAGWDRNFVYYATYVFGTHYRHPLIRKLFVIALFSTTALLGALLPWPTCIVVISFGLLGIFVIFRQWSHIEDDKTFFVERRKNIKIDGDIRFEVIAASLFILIFAPVAFAQLQLANMGFHLDDKAGPFAFEGYTLIEILKIAPLVQYYDLYADILDFRKLGTVTDPSFQAKFAIVAFRASSDLIILGVLKRFLDIAKRVSAGLDLEKEMADLSDGDEIKRNNALDRLGEFALQNKPRAKEYLGDVVTKAKYNSNLEVGVKAAEKLIEVAKRVSKPEANYLLNDLIIKEFSKKVKTNEGSRWYANFCEMKGDAYLAWAERINGERGYRARLDDAKNQYTEAIEHFNGRGDLIGADRVQTKKINAQRLINIEKGIESPTQKVSAGETTQGARVNGAEESQVVGRRDTTENGERIGVGRGVTPDPESPTLPQRLRWSAAALILGLFAATAAASFPLIQHWLSFKWPFDHDANSAGPKIAVPKAPIEPNSGPTEQKPQNPESKNPKPIESAPAVQGTNSPEPKPTQEATPPAKAVAKELVLSPTSIYCGKEVAISWEFAETEVVDPGPSKVQSCRNASLTCKNSIIVGVGMASSKGTDATESSRALQRGVNLASALEKDFQENCTGDVSAYVVNLGRHSGNEEQDGPNQRRVIALINDGTGDEQALAVALEKYLKSHSEFDNYTVCDLYKLKDGGQQSQIQPQSQPQPQHKLCGDQSSGTASLP